MRSGAGSQVAGGIVVRALGRDVTQRPRERWSRQATSVDGSRPSGPGGVYAWIAVIRMGMRMPGMTAPSLATERVGGSTGNQAVHSSFIPAKSS